MNQAPDERLLKLSEVWPLLGVSRSTGFDWVKRGVLPPPINFGPRMRRYRKSDLQNFMASRQEAAS